MHVLVPDYLVDYFRPLLEPSDPDLVLIGIDAAGNCSASIENVEVMYRFYPNHRFPTQWGDDVLRRILRDAPGLRWAHSGLAGVEKMLIPEFVESEIILTNGAGAPKRPIAETVLGYILMDAKASLAHLANQKQSRYQYVPHRELTGLTVAILGLGNIGLEIGRVCKLLDMRVIGTRRRANAETPPFVDEVFPSSRQNDCVAEADYVVVAAASTPETRGMVNGSTFSAMKRDAVLINISRGRLVNSADLLDALRAERIRFAFLDVHDPEPLPSDSPFWGLSNVVITPHNSPHSQRTIENMTRIFVENYARYRKGEPLVNVVDKRAGY